MNINLNNYETFFLLYIDNELSAAEKLSVESFLQEHTYLQAEFDFLKNMVLPAGESFLVDKTSLYRSELMNENMQQAMLLHLDNELPTSSKQELLKKLEDDKNLQKSWEQLQQTKLNSADIVPFPDKKILYRKERGRLVPITVLRWSVAAALIGLGVFVGVLVQRQQEQIKIETASNLDGEKNSSSNIGNKKTEKAGTITSVNNSKTVTADNQQLREDQVPGTDILPQNIAVVKDKKPAKTNDNLKGQPNGMAIKAQNEIGQKQTQEQNDPTTVLASIDEKQRIKKPEENAEVNLIASLNPKKRPDIVDADLTEKIKNSYAKTASINDEQTNDNRILYMDEELVSHSKAGAFFKKLKRTVSRSANIKTGSSLKIAGFDFSVK